MISVFDVIREYKTRENSNLIPFRKIISEWAAPTGCDFLKVTMLFCGVVGSIGLASGLRFRLKQKTSELGSNVKLISLCALGILFPEWISDYCQAQKKEPNREISELKQKIIELTQQIEELKRGKSTPSPSDSIEALPVDP